MYTSTFSSVPEELSSTKTETSKNDALDNVSSTDIIVVHRPSSAPTETKLTGRELVELRIAPVSYLVSIDATLLVPPFDSEGIPLRDGPHLRLDANALLDSGCSGLLMSPSYVQKNDIPLVELSVPVYPKLADGTIAKDPVTHKTAPIVLKIGSHEETVSFQVISLPESDIFLGSPWLYQHNPSINWSAGLLAFDSEYCTQKCINDSLISGTPSAAQPQILKSCVTKIRFPLKDPSGHRHRRQSPQEVVKEIISLHAQALLLASSLGDSFSASSPSSSGTTTMQPSATCCSVIEQPHVQFTTIAHPHVDSAVDTGPAFSNNGPFEQSRLMDETYDDDDDMTATQYLLYLATEVEGGQTIIDALGDEFDEPLFCNYVDPVYPPPPPDIETLKTQVPFEFHDYLDVFSKTLATQLPAHKPWDIKIELLPDTKLPPRSKPYRKTVRERQIEHEWVQKHLELGLIRPSKSQTCASLMFVPKKDDEIGLRPVIDYRPINKVTKKWPYPVPNLDDQLNRLSRKKIITRIDFRSAYYLIRVAEGYEELTAFVTDDGLFEFLVMPFGLTNAPAVFNSFIRETYHDMQDIVVAFFDDIAVASDTIEDNIRDVKRVLQRAREFNLFVKAEKCEFFVTETTFLGHVVSHGQVKVMPSKVEAIRNWPAPTSVRLLRGFLGLCNFYRRFIEAFADIAYVLHLRTRKNRPWSWDQECQAAFDKLKLAMTTAPVLRTFEWIRQCIVEADSSKYAIGAVLSQIFDDLFPHPIEFYSRKLNDAEIKYDTFDKEMLAIVAAFQHWRPYLLHSAHEVIIYTDHHNLEYFMTPRKLNPRQNRWFVYLLEFNFTIKWKPGSQMSKADALSRQFDISSSETEEELRQLIKPEWIHPDSKPPTVLPSTVQALFFFDPTQDEDQRYLLSIFTIDNMQPLDVNKLHGLSLDRIKKAQHNDPDLREIFEYLRRPMDAPHPDSAEDVQLFSISEEGVLLCGNQIQVPNDIQLQLDLCRVAHNYLTLHSGMDKTYRYLAQFFHWRGMTKFIRTYVSGCLKCQRNQTPRHARYGRLKPLRIPDRIHQCLAMDSILGLPPTVKDGFDSIYVFIDRFSKAIQLVPFKASDFTAVDFAEMIENYIFNAWGPPEDIVCDNASLHTSGYLREYVSTRQVTLLYSTAYHPQTDGQTERSIQIVKHYFRKSVEGRDQHDWVRYLPLIQHVYDTTYQSSIKMTPYEARYHIPPITPLMPPIASIKSDSVMTRVQS